uniref:Tyrosine-protein kinase-like otk n=1 Tax=Sinocyclocheilus anshuiensis TaxID=1608454 RepID=A0A671NBC0_9TELE
MSTNACFLNRPMCKIWRHYIFHCVSCGKCDLFYKQVGDEVSMNCGLNTNSDIEWKFNDILIFNIKIKSGTKLKGSSHIASKASTDGETFKVPRLETRDSGNYFCRQSGSVKQHTVYVVSVFAKPGSVLVQSSDAELHCDITKNPNKEVQWLRPPNGQIYHEKNQAIHLKSVTSKDAGQWTCQVKDDLKLSVTLTVVAGLQTTAVNVSEGDDTELPCSLPQSVSQRLVGGKWKADHLPKVSFPTLKNTENKGLHWNGKDSEKVNFTTKQLSTNFDVTLKNVQHSDAGRFVCTVGFEGGASLSVETTLRVVAKPSGGQVFTKGKGKTPAFKEILTKDVYGLKLWIWIAVGASSVVLIGLIIVTVLVRQRNKWMKKRVRKLRSTRQPLTAKDYCQCNRAKNEVELGQGVRPLPVPRQERNPRTRTAGPNYTN